MPRSELGHDDAATTSPKHPNEASAFDRLVDANLEMAACCRELTATVREQSASVRAQGASVDALVGAVHELVELVKALEKPSVPR